MEENKPSSIVVSMEEVKDKKIKNIIKRIKKLLKDSKYTLKEEIIEECEDGYVYHIINYLFLFISKGKIEISFFMDTIPGAAALTTQILMNNLEEKLIIKTGYFYDEQGFPIFGEEAKQLYNQKLHETIHDYLISQGAVIEYPNIQKIYRC